jgi:tetratricopeptide (TPR) repeat protein
MADLVGHTLGKYQLVERLGRGGMADVYRGYQPGLDRFVAVKVLHPHLSEEADFITRFQREAKSVASLHHPHIVQVFDFDMQDGHYYMVMEYIEGGKTLKEILHELGTERQGPAVAQTLDIVAKVADALEYAHSQGMIHRDIKPSNILVRNLAQPVLGDFGIARIVGQTGLTGSGAMIGTPAYMSPEQGRGEQADARSDIYALGIVLYEMLTGKPPYDADTPYGVILKHINDPIVPPHMLMGTLPPDVERIALKSLAKDPADRYQSAGDMRDALRQALVAVTSVTPSSTATPPQGLQAQQVRRDAATTMPAPVMDDGATVATPPPARTETKKASRWWIWGLAGLAVLCLLGAVIVGPRVLRNRQAQIGEASVQPQEIQELVALGFDQIGIGETEAAIASFDQILASKPNNPYALAGRGIAHIGQGEPDAAAADITQAAEIAPDDAVVNFALGTLHTQAEGYYDSQAALAEFTKTIEGCGDNIRLCSEAYHRRAQVQAWDDGNLEQGIADMDQAIAAMPDRDDIYYLYVTRADMKAATGAMEGAFADYEAAHQKSGWGEYLERAAAAAVRADNFDKALAYYDQLLKEKAGDPHYLIGRGYVEWQAGDMEAALQTADRALSLQQDATGAHYLKGLLLLETGKPQEAMVQFELVSKASEDPYSYGFPFLMRDFGYEIFFDMARAAYAMGELDKAFALCDQSIARSDWPLPYVLKGRMLTDRGELEAAREQYLLALERAYGNEELEAHINNLLAELSG